jgi:hypothetical protein
VVRAAAKAAREQEKAKQASSRAQEKSSRRAAKAPQQRIKLADKGNKKAARLPIEAEKRKKQALKVAGGMEDSAVASAAQPITRAAGATSRCRINTSSTDHLNVVKECSVTKDNDNIHQWLYSLHFSRAVLMFPAHNAHGHGNAIADWADLPERLPVSMAFISYPEPDYSCS